jgi:hypothetical protein
MEGMEGFKFQVGAFDALLDFPCETPVPDRENVLDDADSRVERNKKSSSACSPECVRNQLEIPS